MTQSKLIRQFKLPHETATQYAKRLSQFRAYSLFGISSDNELLLLMNRVNEITLPFGKHFDYREFLALIVVTHNLSELIYKIAVRCRTSEVIDPIAEVFEPYKGLNY